MLVHYSTSAKRYEVVPTIDGRACHPVIFGWNLALYRSIAYNGDGHIRL